jgi:hypothetical protein
LGGVINHSSEEDTMRRFTNKHFALRMSLVASFILVLAAVLPLVALAGQGDPSGV